MFIVEVSFSGLDEADLLTENRGRKLAHCVHSLPEDVFNKHLQSIDNARNGSVIFHDYVSCVDNPRNIPQNSQGNVDPEVQPDADLEKKTCRWKQN